MELADGPTGQFPAPVWPGSRRSVSESLPCRTGCSSTGDHAAVPLTYAPDNARDADALATGLRFYSLYRGLHGASIRQSGHGNAAGIGQNGRGNLGIIQQEGNGHSATLQQNDNAYGIFQFGRNTHANVAQSGDDGGGATFSYGW